MERRSYPRVRVFHSVYYETTSSPSAHVASTQDLSVGGAAIESVGTIALGETLKISLVIPPQIIRCTAKVVHTLRLLGERVRIGVQFEDISKNDALYLEGYLSRVMMHRKEDSSLRWLGFLLALGVSLLAWAAIIYLISRLI